MNPSDEPRTVVWFSCGAASAVAAKLAVERGGNVHIVYCDTLSTEHPDNRRFFADVERWLGRSITVIRSDKYTDINDVFVRTRYRAGIAGARCTTELKKLPRQEFERMTDTHIFGYTADASERRRAVQFEKQNPAIAVEWLLIDSGVSKDDCLIYLQGAGIELPAMYGLGFDHNNCIACPKATSPGYWNRTRRLFPDIFALRAKQSRLIGARLVRVKGVRMFLDELPEDADAPDDNIDCGPVCQTPAQ